MAQKSKMDGAALAKLAEGLSDIKSKLPERKTGGSTLRDVIKTHMPMINLARERGYSLTEVVEYLNANYLNETGYTLTLSNLRAYISSFKKDTDTPTAPKSPKTAKNGGKGVGKNTATAGNVDTAKATTVNTGKGKLVIDDDVA